MPPELLVAGKLTPAADVYSFGIMMWEMVSRTPPFHGLHHGEIIHKVVTQDLRPGEGWDGFGGQLWRQVSARLPGTHDFARDTCARDYATMSFTWEVAPFM
jgi:serine/threonine protein kinase